MMKKIGGKKSCVLKRPFKKFAPKKRKKTIFSFPSKINIFFFYSPKNNILKKEKKKNPGPGVFQKIPGGFPPRGGRPKAPPFGVGKKNGAQNKN